MTNYFNDIIPSDFCNQEIRCDFLITPEMKKVWLCQLEILYALINVCKKHNLRYYAISGTLLGAIRHKGYIPWDDDIDVVMPREDYDILCSNPSWFVGKIQLHLPSNKELYYEGWARLHNIETAVLYPNFKKEGSKQGIYIDIFPLDNFDNSDYKRRKIINRINVIGHAISYNCNNNFLLRLFSSINKKIRLIKPESLFKKINKLSKSNLFTGQIAVKTCTVLPLSKNKFDSSLFSASIEVPFEFINISIPIGYETILKTAYGDFMKFPPKEKRGTWHDFSFSVDCPYNEFNKKQRRSF